MTTLRLALALLASGLFATVAAAEPAARVRASVSAKGDVWVGQRVTLVVELLAPGLFNTAPNFDLPQVPGVVLLPPEGRPVISSESIEGTTYTSQRHELAVYAQRAGRVEILAFPVRFESSPAFGKPAVAQRVTTPGLAFTAKMPPGAEGLSTVLVTPELTMAEVWEPQPGKTPRQPGAAYTRTITVEARDVPGMVLPPLRFDPPDGLGVYPKPPVVEDRTERGEATGRRVEKVTYVCERAGIFSLPALVLTWWDPTERKLKRAELPGQTFEVAPPPPASPAVQPAPDARQTWVWIAGVLGAVVAAGVVVWRFAPTVAGWWRRHREAAAESEAAYFAAFERSCRTDNAGDTLRALLAWLDRFLPDDPAPSIETLVARAADPELTAALTALDDAVYGRRASSWSAEGLPQRVRAARRRLLQCRTPEHAVRFPLPPLNPGE